MGWLCWFSTLRGFSFSAKTNISLFDLICSLPNLPFPAQGVPHWQVKSSGVRQSKIFKCQLALTGGKGSNGDLVFDDVVVNQLPESVLKLLLLLLTLELHFKR